MKLIDALRELDPHNDMDWTGEGVPAMAALEALVADRKVTREEVNEITGGAKRPKPGEPVPDFYRQPIPSPSRIVMVSEPNTETAPAIVSRTNEDGTLNAHIFQANSGVPRFLTGLKHKHQLEALPDGDAGRNLPFWEWPKRG
jgi:hypothetical protein